jgi:hypothetical protein
MEQKNTKVRILAFYLPQYYPIPENDKWWGKDFTEWTNVRKAKPLFRGHEQPKIPTELGYYDLRVPETRIAQAELAKKAGIEGFCYWHYWFGNGKRLLERTFNEVLESGQPDFPFCLGWANHSWSAKTWSPGGNDRLLIEQLYPGKNDFIKHFYEILPAFKDTRYIRVNNKPLFLIWDPDGLKNTSKFIQLWNNLAKNNGLEGVYFVAFSFEMESIQSYLSEGFDSVCLDLIKKPFENLNNLNKLVNKFRRILFSQPSILKYKTYCKYYLKEFPISENVISCIYPNFDHTPRSGKYGRVLRDCTPEEFCSLLKAVIDKQIFQDDSNRKIVFIKSWNEWGEGNYLEPDLIDGDSYISEMGNLFKITKL